MAFDVDVYGPGIADILICPVMVEELLTGEELIRGGWKVLLEFQLLWRHVDRMAFIED